MRTGSAVGIVMQAVMWRSRRIVLRLATIQFSSGPHRHVDVNGARCRA